MISILCFHIFFLFFFYLQEDDDESDADSEVGDRSHGDGDSGLMASSVDMMCTSPGFSPSPRSPRAHFRRNFSPLKY